MTPEWVLYLVIGIGLGLLTLLLVRELDPKDHPDEYWRLLDSILVVLAVVWLIALLIEFNILAASI